MRAELAHVRLTQVTRMPYFLTTRLLLYVTDFRPESAQGRLVTGCRLNTFT